ncbi:hypothetical protein F4782DRAFT_506084 [Xylaria castorea]|nr:hypothetical protein F4782DRAFT_506084 [Xylaria castorea]
MVYQLISIESAFLLVFLMAPTCNTQRRVLASRFQHHHHHHHPHHHLFLPPPPHTQRLAPKDQHIRKQRTSGFAYT